MALALSIIGGLFVVLIAFLLWANSAAEQMEMAMRDEFMTNYGPMFGGKEQNGP